MTSENQFTSHVSLQDKIFLMLKYIKNYAASIKDIDIYPMISLLIFVLFFAAVIYYVKKMDKRRIDEIKQLPLDLDVESNASVQTIKPA
jgi:cytochrome c oxidase cbb3-type subunit IV